MAEVNYTVKLTSLVNDYYTTAGCLDTSVLNGLSNQRTVEMLSAVDKVIGRKNDGDVFSADIPYAEELGFIEPPAPTTTPAPTTPEPEVTTTPEPIL